MEVLIAVRGTETEKKKRKTEKEKRQRKREECWLNGNSEVGGRKEAWKAARRLLAWKKKGLPLW